MLLGVPKKGTKIKKVAAETAVAGLNQDDAWGLYGKGGVEAEDRASEANPDAKGENGDVFPCEQRSP